MDKRALTERDICTTLILPAVSAADDGDGDLRPAGGESHPTVATRRLLDTLLVEALAPVDARELEADE